MYGEGIGVPQDYAEAYFWLTLASTKSGDDQHDAQAGRDMAAQKLTPDVLLAVQKWAREWKPTAPAQQGKP